MPLFVVRFQAMASANEVQLVAPDEVTARAAAAAAVDEVARIERAFSRYRDDSIISRINGSAGGAPVEVDPETAALLDYAQACHAQSRGLFDITSGVLRRAWNFRVHALPAQATIDALLPLIGWEKVEWRRPWFRLPRAGMEIDFGGIGKEYAADRAGAMLAQAGVTHGLVNLGGDVRILGPQPDGSPWTIGIQHPRLSDRVIARIRLAQGALATSGDYERYIEVDGRRYCHLLDPHTGCPVHGARSVSVAAPLCIVAGGLSSMAMLKGAGAKAFLESQDLPWLMVDAEGRLDGALAVGQDMDLRPVEQGRPLELPRG